MKRRLIILLTVALVLLCTLSVLAETGSKAGILNYREIRVMVDGREIPLPGTEPFIMDGTVYLPLNAVPDAFWDEAANTVFIGGKTGAEETPSRCWVLTNVVHEVDPDEKDGPRTWHYDYQEIADGGRYIIDYTWQHNQEYAHYTAVGEISNPPAFVLPGQIITMDIREYNENVTGDRGWGIMSLSGVRYDRIEDIRSVSPHGFYTVENGEYTPFAKTYNASEGDQAWQMWADFPEGLAGETISFTCQFHRGNSFPVRTTWTYSWRE